MKVFEAKMKDIKRRGKLLLMVVLISLMALTATEALALEPVPILELTISDTARVVDHDDGIYVVGTSSGDLYVINEAGDYTVTALGAGRINDVRIENGFIAVAAYRTVIELSLAGLTPVELWRTTDSDWYQVVSTDLSEDGGYVTYLAQRYPGYVNAGEIGVLSGTDGSLISSLYTSGYRPTNFWIDATGDMEYIAASHPTYPPYYRVGVGLYQFDGSTLTFQWWTQGVARYEVTEVRISENKDYVAFGTSSGTWMKMLGLSDGAVLWAHETPGKEQFACDGDVDLNYVIGATRYWSSPYPWFVLKNSGTSYQVLAEGTMSGRVDDLDSNPDASLLAFGSDAGEFLLLRRSGDTIETVFDEDLDEFIDAIEIGSDTLLVGGSYFINLYGWNRPPEADAGPDQTVEQDSHAGASVTLDGSGSSDPDGDPLTYSWTWDGESATGVGPTIVLPLGTTTITLVVNDGTVDSDPDTVDISVEDTTPPTINSVSASPDVLWPVNHKMVEVTVTVDCEDICDRAPFCYILGVSSNEPINGPGDGNTEPDWDYTDDPLVVLLRAERAGVGTDRIYTIHIECKDVSGNIASEIVEVIVPHDQGKGKK